MTTTPNVAVGRTLRRALIATAGVGLVAASLAGPAMAKEVGSETGAGTTTTTCNPVKSLSYRGDYRAGETGLSTITVTYDVRACDKARPVVVDAQLYLTADPSAVAYDDPAAPLSGKFTAVGVKGNTSYIAKITVTDAGTGAVVGSRQIFAAAVRKVGV